MVVTSEGMTASTADALDFLLMELKDVGAAANEWTLFGSASLLLNGVDLGREPGDIDVFVSRRVWGELLSHDIDWYVETPKAGDPPILVSTSADITIHLFYDWSDRYVHMDVPGLLAKSYWAGDSFPMFKVIPVEDALDHKRKAMTYGSKAVEKHIPDIAIIEDWLKAR